MASNQTKRQLAERILIKFSGAAMSDDIQIDERFVVTEINQAIATMAKASFGENSNIDGIAYANDQFVCTYKGVAILTESDSGLKYSVLPDTPVGLPKGRGLVMVMPPAGIENTIKPINIREVPMLLHQRPIPNRTFYWLESGKIFFLPTPNFAKVTVRMVSSGIDDIDTPMNIPPETLLTIEKMVRDNLMMLFQVRPDVTNDGQTNNK